MLCFISGVSGIAIGIYAGKMRANGSGWGEISKSLANDVSRSLKTAWGKMSSLFRACDKKKE